MAEPEKGRDDGLDSGNSQTLNLPSPKLMGVGKAFPLENDEVKKRGGVNGLACLASRLEGGERQRAARSPWRAAGNRA